MNSRSFISRIEKLKSPLSCLAANINRTVTLFVVVFFPAFLSYSQSLVKTGTDSYSNLDHYLWGFSKNKATAHKPLVDFNVMDNWRGLGWDLSVSDDGNYFSYTINKMIQFPGGRFAFLKLDSLIIQSTNSGKRTVLHEIQSGSFTADNKQYIFKDGTTLCFLQLNGMQTRKINDVASFKISQNKWIAYQSKGTDDLTLQNLLTGKEKSFAAVKDYNFDASGSWLICKGNGGELLLHGLATGAEKQFPSVVDYVCCPDGKTLVVKTNANLQYISLTHGQAKNIWTINEKAAIGSYSLDASGKQVLFSLVDNTDAGENSIGYYQQGMDKAIVKINNQTEGIPKGLTISDASFAINKRYINVSLHSKPNVAGQPDESRAGVEVWNTKDVYLKSKNSQRASEYQGVVSIENGKLVFLESIDKRIFLSAGEFVLVKRDYQSEYGDRFWEKMEDSCWLVSLEDGSRHLLPFKPKPYSTFWFSPSGNYLVYFDPGKGCHYYSYDLQSGVLKDITLNVPENQLGLVDRQNDQSTKQGNLAAWVEEDEGILVYDNYDIWKLDLTGNSSAVNLTNGFGKSNSIILNLFKTNHYSGDVPVVKSKERLLLRAFNIKSKESGFYEKSVAHVGDPELVYMGRYFMGEIGGIHDENVMTSSSVGNLRPQPVKAKNTSYWIVQRQSANDAPNYYQTTDFKNYKRLTNYQPQKGFQWLTEELHSFKHLDGTPGQGILYKPENFDPNKKYPVIIPVYGQFSNNLNQYQIPFYIDQAMAVGKSPLWFLNNGYLVFAPDVVVTPLKYGPKIFSCIEGAVEYLKQLPYVDSDKLGCAGHSWSSKYGAYMFTHSTSFAATAISGCGTYNPISNALSPNYYGLQTLERGEGWGSLWENKDAWLDITAVLQANKAKGAILMLENKKSSPIYLDQVFQMFTALRRLDKKAWWLQYDKGDHILSDQKELQDYTVRYTQFFDHYLKNAPAPLWMTQGIPLKPKIENRYELDPKGTCNTPNGEPCPICEAWNDQYKRTPGMFQKEIKDWNLEKDIADELERKQNARKKELDNEGEIRTREVLRMLNSGK